MTKIKRQYDENGNVVKILSSDVVNEQGVDVESRLAQAQEDIDSLKQNGGGGGSVDVPIASDVVAGKVKASKRNDGASKNPIAVDAEGRMYTNMPVFRFNGFVEKTPHIESSSSVGLTNIVYDKQGKQFLYKDNNILSPKYYNAGGKYELGLHPIADQLYLSDGVFYVANADKTLTKLGASSVYESAIEDKELSMPNAVGGIAKGTQVGQLEGLTTSELFDELLFPTIEPTFVNPSASLSLKDYAAIQEVGAASPDSSTKFNKSFSQGEIRINGVKKDNRAGAKTSDKIYAGSSSSAALPSKVAEGNTLYYYEVNYAEGPQPKDNKGVASGSKLSAGKVTSSAVKVNGSYPVFVGSTKQTLKEWGGTITQTLSMPAHSKANPIKFKVPKKTITSLKQLNTASGKYESVDMGKWTKTTENITIQGTSISYNVYTLNSDKAQDPVSLQITF